MASDRRRFELPGIEELSKEQEAVLALPNEGRHLVVGGPGTGKTVLCLLRARRLAQKGEDYRFLVWNHLLFRASQALVPTGLRAETWNRWFWHTYKDLVGNTPPLQATGEHHRPYDWQGVQRTVEELPPATSEERPYLVIDEGQDMPPGFYDFLNQLGFRHLFVAADQNQQIKPDENSSIRELEECLAVDTQPQRLRHNFRNSYQVARLARAFATDDPASPLPDLPPVPRSVNAPWLYYRGRVKVIARSILRHWDQDPRRLIGVIAPDNHIRRRYFEALKDCTVALDNGRPWIETFFGEHRPKVPFGRGGVLVINAQACKGMEFDTAVLADIDQHRVQSAVGGHDLASKRFYVMVSRAKRRVVLFAQSETAAIEDLLPEDEQVLRRWDLGRSAKADVR